MAKTYSPAPGVVILFNRRVVAEVRAPSGRMVKVWDDAPAILAVNVGDATVYYERSATGWRDMSGDADEVIAGIIEEETAATKSKHTPKL